MAFDHIVVGGGSAGVALAARLTEDPDRTVLLLEAGDIGPLDTDLDLLSNINFALTGRDWGMHAFITKERELEYAQGKFLGGGSSVNGGLAIRGMPADYDAWAAAGNPKWTWAHMLERFTRLEHDLDFGSEDIHGDAGPIPIVRWHDDELLPVQRGLREAATGAGLPWVEDHNRPGATGIGPFPMNRAEGRRMSTALTYYLGARDRENLTVYGTARAHRVVIADGRATGVVVERDAGIETIDAGEVIVSSGAIHSPSLLARSGVGPADHLRRLGIDVVVDNPAVGANLVDHPGVFLFCQPGRVAPDTDATQFQIGARYSSRSGGVENDMLLSMMNYWDLTESPDFQSFLGVPMVVVVTCGVHEPRSRGHVAIASDDPTVQPEIAFTMLDQPADVERLVEGVRLMHEIATAAPLADFLDRVLVLDDGAFDDDVALETYVRNFVAPWYHASGSCRMGPAGDDTVVDPELRVHGIDGLRVADQSIVPTIPRAPTNLTAIAVGEACAELIRAE
jgi:choline dehydrogenase